MTETSSFYFAGVAADRLFGNHLCPHRHIRILDPSGTSIAISRNGVEKMDIFIQHYKKNMAGRDYAVGDIHGHFSRLEHAMETIGFDPSQDRLFSVGDLVDRGPQADQALDWLALPWFHAVRGNHEDYAIRHSLIGGVDIENYRSNGGGWFLDMPRTRQKQFGLVFNDLPYAMEIETDNGLVGIIHAVCPVPDWAQLADALGSESARMQAIWSRDRIQSLDETKVKNIHAVVVGHTPLQEVVALGNTVHIDTGGWLEKGHFTLLDLGNF